MTTRGRSDIDAVIQMLRRKHRYINAEQIMSEITEAFKQRHRKRVNTMAKTNVLEQLKTTNDQALKVLELIQSRDTPAIQPGAAADAQVDADIEAIRSEIYKDDPAAIAALERINGRLKANAHIMLHTIKPALNAQVTEYESRGQVLYRGLGAPSSIRLVYDILGKRKPADLPATDSATIKFALDFFNKANRDAEDQEYNAADYCKSVILGLSMVRHIQALHSDNKRLTDALVGLNRGNRLAVCFCEMAGDNPMVKKHSTQCIAAQVAIESNPRE
jgi:hypothetical protein